MNVQPTTPLETRYSALLSGEWLKLSLSEKKKLLRQLNEFSPGSQSWRGFLKSTFPFLALKEFAPHQVEFWEWVWAIAPNIRPRPFIALWARGAAKSTSAELAAALVGITQRRAYIVYASGTQDLADRHVESIGSLLERAGIERAVNKYGSSRGWRRSRLRTNTFTIDSLGLDTGARGIRVDEARPGLIVLDDVDSLHDTLETTRKKIETLTATILPSGSNDCAVLFVQNIIAKDSIAARLADKRADFLADRIVSGAYPALRNFSYDGGEISGEPTWEGQSLDDCRAFVKTWGLRAFLRECQHDVAEIENGLWKREWIDAGRVTQHPVLSRIVVGVDPPGGLRTECGIVAAGMADNHLYVLEDASRAGSPAEWGRAVVTLYHKLKADCVVAEDNFGGEMVKNTIHGIDPSVPIRDAHATRGKIPRAEPIALESQEGREHFVGSFPQLEDELCNYAPGMPSPNRMDAYCLVAGTTIATMRGDIPIEQVRTSDFVLTRGCWQKVLWSGITQFDAPLIKVSLSNRKSLTGTAGHPIWVEGKGFVPLHTLAWYDIMRICKTKEKYLLFSRDLHIRLSRILKMTGAGIISPVDCKTDFRLGVKCCIGTFGNLFMERFQRDLTFITAMAIRLTMTSLIWNAYRGMNTQKSIAGNVRIVKENTLMRYVAWRVRGMGVPPEKNGTGNWEFWLGKKESLLRGYVYNAGIITRQRLIEQLRAFVRGFVSLDSMKPRKDTGKSASARCAEMDLRSRNQANNGRAQVSVLGLSDAGRGTVYNLTVENNHEYFANGVLVHNCWSATELTGEVGLAYGESPTAHYRG